LPDNNKCDVWSLLKIVQESLYFIKAEFFDMK